MSWFRILLFGILPVLVTQGLDFDYLRKVYLRIKKEYVEPVDDKKSLEAAIQGILSGLDSYSYYLNSEEFKNFSEDIEGKYSGIGIELKNQFNSYLVLSVLDDSPALKAGLKPGDRILEVNGEKVHRMSISEVVSKIRGPSGTEVNLKILRSIEQRDQELHFTVTRGLIHIRPVTVKVFGDGIIYLRISKFVSGVGSEIKAALKDLRFKKNRGLVIDVRSNPGGLLEESIKVANIFLPRGLIVETRSRHKDQQKKYYATESVGIRHLPCLILIDSGTASAGEILAGALKDNGYCFAAGEKTFGKGSVQTAISLPDNSALVLTTAYYFTKSGKKIEGEGIEPDFEVSNPNKDYLFSLEDWRNKSSEDYLAKDPVFRFAMEKINELTFIGEDEVDQKG